MLIFGKIVSQSGTLNTKDGFTGHEEDTDTGLVYAQARYYNPSSLRFSQQDPSALYIGRHDFNNLIGIDQMQLLLDPQQLNSYSYVRNNPINGTDPTGLFNLKTGKVEKGDTLKNITQLLNKTNSTNYTVSQLSKLNNIKDANKITVGQTLIPNENVPDITKSLTSLMKQNASNFRINNPFYFKNQVRNSGPWNLKNSPDYDTGIYQNGFVFNAENIRSDSPANIHYGYVGNAAFWGVPSILLREAGDAQIKAGTSMPEWKNGFYGDDPLDQSDIMKGIELRRNNN